MKHLISIALVASVVAASYWYNNHSKDWDDIINDKEEES